MRVLIAAPDWEAGVTLPPGPLRLVRRCCDLEDLLVTAATGVADGVLVSSELPRLDRDALARLRALGLVVVGLVPAADEEAERRLRQLGLDSVHASDAPGEQLAASLTAAWAEVAGEAPAVAAFAHPVPVPVPPPPPSPDSSGARGQVVAVWGPAGAPGRTTVATHLAAEVACLGWPTLLVDADPYGGTVALGLGLPQEAPGLAAACRRANVGTLDAAAFAELLVEVGPGLGVLTGLDRAHRWPEVRPAALDAVLTLCRSRAAVSVVDVGFCLEQDEELSYDTLAPRRNGATLTVLEQADLVVVVGAADVAGVQRLLVGLDELREVAPDARTSVVLNKVRPSGVPGEAEARELLRRHAGVTQVTCVPWDQAALDLALRHQRPLVQAAPHSDVRRALAGLAAALVGA